MLPHKLWKQLFLCNSMDGHNSIFCTLTQCQVLVNFFLSGGSGIIGCMADLNLISSGIRRIPETSFVRAYIEPFIHPLISMNVALYLALFQPIFEADQSSKCQNDYHILFLLNFLYQQLYCDVVEIWKVNCQHDGQRYRSLKMLNSSFSCICSSHTCQTGSPFSFRSRPTS